MLHTEDRVHPAAVISRFRRSLLGLVVAGATVALALPAAASAAPVNSGFSCRASAARVALTGLPVIEPFVANKADVPCRADTANVLTPTTIGPLMVNAVNVMTSQTPAQLGSTTLPDGSNAAASSSVTMPALTLPGLTISANVLTANAAFTCRAGSPVASSDGKVVGLVINGNPITVPPGDNVTIPLGPLGSLVLNQVDTSQPGRIIRRAVNLTTPAGSVIISEAIADITNNPCAAAATTPPAPKTPPPAGGIPRGTARLVVTPPSARNRIAAGRCVRSFTATVRGRSIARVVFSLNGRVIRTVTRAPFSTRVLAPPGRNRLTARVTFLAASRTRARTLALRFTGCARGGPHPRFTG